MKNVYKDPIKAIHKATRAGDYDALSDALDLAYNSGGRSASEKSELVFGYSVLADAYGQDNPVDALQAHDRARQMYPGDKGLLQGEIDFLKEFIDFNKGKLGKDDYAIIQVISILIKSLVPVSQKEVANKICEPLGQNKINQSHAIKTESKASIQLRQMGQVLHLKLKPEQRTAIAKELTPHLPALIKAAEKIGLFDELRREKNKNKKS